MVEKVVSCPGLKGTDRLAAVSSTMDCSLESRRDLRLRRELSGLRRRRGSLIIVTAEGGLLWVASAMSQSISLYASLSRSGVF